MQPAAQGQAWAVSSALSHPGDNTWKRKVSEKGSSPNPGSTVLAVSSITARYEELNQAPQGLKFLQPWCGSNFHCVTLFYITIWYCQLVLKPTFIAFYWLQIISLLIFHIQTGLFQFTDSPKVFHNCSDFKRCLFRIIFLGLFPQYFYFLWLYLLLLHPLATFYNWSVTFTFCILWCQFSPALLISQWEWR